MSKDILQLKDDIFLIINSFSLYADYLVSKVLDEEKLLEERIDVACCRKIFQARIFVCNLLYWRYVPFFLSSP